MNIDLGDGLYESRPHRNLWISVLLLAFEDALSDEGEIRYPALEWFFDEEYQDCRTDVFCLADQEERVWANTLLRVIMHKYMEDSITDGIQFEEDYEPVERDPDEAYDTMKQDELDEVLRDIARALK